MSDNCGVVAIGMLFTLIIGTAMGADPLMGVVVLTIMYISVCM